MRNRRALRWSVMALGMSLACATSPVLGQQPVPAGPGYTAGGWTGYAPNNTWQGYAPGTVWPAYGPSNAWAGYAPRPAVVPSTATTTASNTSAWSGYAPGTAWRGYNPGTAWRGYAPTTNLPRVVWRGNNPPNRPGESYSFHAGEARIYGARVRAIAPTAYRELGTGRPVPLSKPWLPGSS